MSGKIRVVVVGGGSAGQVAYNLSSARTGWAFWSKQALDPARVELTLISRLPYHIHMVSAARIVTTSTDDLASVDKAFVPLDRIFKPENAGSFVQGKVVNVFEDHVELEDGKKVGFDFLVLGTGSVWPSIVDFNYTNPNQVKAHVDAWRAHIASAKKVVIVGGGAVGCELAGEIKHFYPSTKVTIVHALPRPLNEAYPDYFRDKLAAKLAANDIEVITGDKLEAIPPAPAAGTTLSPVRATTQKGLTIEADLFIPAIGPRPNTDLLRSLASGSALTAQNRVRVSPSLNVAPTSLRAPIPNIWALGDIIEWDEQKQLAKAGEHLKVVTKNVLAAVIASEEGKSEKEVAQAGSRVVYKGSFEGIAVTQGPTGGLGFLPFFGGFTLGDWAMRTVKSKTLFVPMVRGGYGLK